MEVSLHLLLEENPDGAKFLWWRVLLNWALTALPCLKESSCRTFSSQGPSRGRPAMPSEQLCLCGQDGSSVLWESAGLPSLGLPGNGSFDMVLSWARGLLSNVSRQEAPGWTPARLRARRRPRSRGSGRLLVYYSPAAGRPGSVSSGNQAFKPVSKTH